MKNTKITKLRRLIYHLRHRYLTMSNVVIGIALIIGASWAWGSIGMMQRNYSLQKEIDTKSRQQQLVELEMLTLTYQQNYFKSNEYKELAARQYLGLASRGEKVLILPPNTPAAKSADDKLQPVVTKQTAPPSDFQQWMNFLFGGNQAGLQK